MTDGAIRPTAKPWANGFNLMYALVAVVVLAWVGVLSLPDKLESQPPFSGGFRKDCLI